MNDRAQVCGPPAGFLPMMIVVIFGLALYSMSDFRLSDYLTVFDVLAFFVIWVVVIWAITLVMPSEDREDDPA